MDAKPFLTIWNDREASNDEYGLLAEPLAIEIDDSSSVRPLTEKAKQAATQDFLASASGDRNDLRLQRWGVVVPEGPEGDRLLSFRAVQDLIEYRSNQQGAEAVVYRVKPGMNLDDSDAFVDGEYWDKVERKTERLPQYLLLLGGTNGVSWQLQQTLGRHGVFTGRLPFVDEPGYEAYVAKLKKWEERRIKKRDALFYIVRDGSAMLVDAREKLLRPMHDTVRVAADRYDYDRNIAVKPRSVGLDDIEAATPAEQQLEALLEYARKAEGGALVSVSHGLGVPDATQRRAKQGGLCVSNKRTLFAEDLKSGPFLPGGAWFFFACFGAGTPDESAYATWFKRVQREDRAARALTTIAGQGESFVAALPMAALANPDGPLAVVGHVDFAWSWSYEPVRNGTGDKFVPRSERLTALMESWLRGHRFGPAHHVLSKAATSIGSKLMGRYEHNPEDTNLRDETWQSQTAQYWLEYQDLNGYVLLGDPAAALPGSEVLSKAQVSKPQSPKTKPQISQLEFGAKSAASDSKPQMFNMDIESAEAAVLRLLSSPSPKEAKTISQIAEQYRVSPEDLARRAEAYQTAGRRALLEQLGQTESE